MVAAYNRPVIPELERILAPMASSRRRCPISVQDRSRSSWHERLRRPSPTTVSCSPRRHRYRQDLRLSGAGAAFRGKVIIATGTKTLQDQLFDRDLPRVRDALKLPVESALLKGRSNYVCHYHLARTRSEGASRRATTSCTCSVAAFAERSVTGDRADCETVPESSPVWPLVTSTRDNCLGSECGHYKECFVLKARKEALLADVVVVNHHLLFADIALKDDGLASCCPPATPSSLMRHIARPT